MKIQHRLAVALLAAAALAPPAAARAQQPLPTVNLLEEQPKDPDAEERRAKIDEAYRNSQKRTAPAQPQAADPWGSIRAPESGKPAAPAKKQAGAKEGAK
jgi:hypothetical protein